MASSPSWGEHMRNAASMLKPTGSTRQKLNDFGNSSVTLLGDSGLLTTKP